MTSNAYDPRTALLAAPMSGYQKIAVTVVFLLNMLDGLDVMAISFAAPAIRESWGIAPATVGLVFSSGLFGMAAGSLFLAPLADVIGRRQLIFLSLVMMIVGTLWSAVSHTVASLLWSRVFTGLGIGAMVAVISSLTAEYSNTRHRDFCQSIFSVGFPIGGLLGGVLAGILLPSYGWQSIFYVASAMGVALIPVVWFFLPEPIATMIARPKSGTLARVNRYLQRCRMPAIEALPAPPAAARGVPLAALFQAGMSGLTLTITAIYFLHVMTLFFVQNWAPSLVASLGFDPGRAAMIAVFVNVGGIIGSPLLGATCTRFGLQRLVVIAMCAGALVTALFSFLPANFALLALGSAAMGFFLQSAMMGLYAIIARTFPAHIRASGTGFVIGIGRVGSAISPLIAGALMSGGFSRTGVAFVLAAPALLAALLLLKFRVQSADTP